VSKAEGSVDKRVRKTRNALMDSLLSLMQEKDFRDISVTDIVETADINRGTFYRHFQYKEELLEELPRDRSGKIDQALLSSYHSYALFGITHSPAYMAEQLLSILHSSVLQSLHVNLAKKNHFLSNNKEGTTGLDNLALCN